MVIFHFTYVAIRHAFVRSDDVAYSIACDGTADIVFTAIGAGVYIIETDSD